MNQVVLIDTGPLVALLDRRDRYHAWAVEQVSRLHPPSHTCEAVIAEAFHLLRQLAILEMPRAVGIPFAHAPQPGAGLDCARHILRIKGVYSPQRGWISKPRASEAPP